jgi:indole-3-glycerol phosphate synthase
MNILETIVASKRKEVAARKASVPAAALERSPGFARAVVSLKQSIRDPARTGIIAEFKRRSPSKGVINDRSSVDDVLRGYIDGGASGLSVLTDTDFFGGATADLERARTLQEPALQERALGECGGVPILRKDFIIDEYQVLEARAMGADVILLIASCLSPARVLELAKFARGLDLEVLLELHEEAELDHINPYTELVGVNNRNLKTFSVDMDKSIRMADRIGNSWVRIAESGIGSVEDVVSLRQCGFEGFLIGEYFMKQEDPAAAFRAFTQNLRRS